MLQACILPMVAIWLPSRTACWYLRCSDADDGEDVALESEGAEAEPGAAEAPQPGGDEAAVAMEVDPVAQDPDEDGPVAERLSDTAGCVHAAALQSYNHHGPSQGHSRCCWVQFGQ
jgi:hypothetical protein